MTRTKLRFSSDCLPAVRGVFSGLLLCAALVALPSHAADEGAIKFVLKPQRCVTLREGQPCFVKLKVTWVSELPVSVCVYDEGETPLVCWVDVAEGSFFGKQYLYETTRYTLRDTGGVELGESTVTVAWVYKSRRARKRWRLF